MRILCFEIKYVGNFSLGLSYEEAQKQVFDEMVQFAETCEQLTYGYYYDTPSGKLEVGCLYWDNSLPENYFWDNHKGPYLMAILPNGDHWNIDSRANNCALPNDRLHRCWVRTGEIPNITVGNDGNTCKAGAGSILSGSYHGFLTNGEFTECLA